MIACELHMATAKLLVIDVYYLLNYNGIFFASTIIFLFVTLASQIF